MEQVVVGMTVESPLLVLKRWGPRVFKVWFNEAQSANTYVNEMHVTGLN